MRELMRAKDQLLAAAARSLILEGVYVEGLPPAPQIELVIDREKAAALRRDLRGDQQHHLDQSRLGLHQRLSEPRAHAARVIVQADRAARMQADEIMTYNVRNARAQLVPMSSFATVQWSSGRRRSWASTTIRRCASPARRSPATPRATRSARWSGSQASCRAASAYEWTGQSLQEKQSGSQAPFLLGAVGAAGVPGAGGAL